MVNEPFSFRRAFRSAATKINLRRNSNSPSPSRSDQSSAAAATTAAAVGTTTTAVEASGSVTVKDNQKSIPTDDQKDHRESFSQDAVAPPTAQSVVDTTAEMPAATSKISDSSKSPQSSGPLESFMNHPGFEILEKAKEALEQDERAVLDKVALGNPAKAFDEAYTAAETRQEEYKNKGVWTIKGHRIEWRVLADNIVKFLDKFKSAGDLIATADPVHVGIPWAVVKILLTIPLASKGLMGALLSGLESALYVGNRLKAYYEYLPKLEASQARKNFEEALLKLQTKLFKFLAQAIILYDKNAIARSWIAVWGNDKITAFDVECNKVADQVEKEASNCDREIFTSIRRELAGLDSMKESLNEISSEVQLPKLAYAEGARYDSRDEEDRPKCLDETRVQLLDEIYRWAESDQPGEPHIFWLQGNAGTGKSTVSRTVARYLDNLGFLGASFFFNRDYDHRKHSDRLFTTIASDLVRKLPIIKDRVLDEIRKDGQISTMPLEVHFQNLILGPCRDCVEDETTIVLVIDALDECEERSDLPKILRLLSRASEVRRARLRVFLTSRPEIEKLPEFKDAFKFSYLLKNLDETPSTKNDISTYFTNEFARMKLKPDSPADWPGRDVVDRLATEAMPSFIFAATTCRFIGDPEFTPKDQLKLVQKFAYPHLASNMDKTYLPILAQLGGSGDQKRGKRLQQQFHKLLEMIVLLADPLSPHALTELMKEDGMSLEIVQLRLRRLRSVLYTSDKGKSPVRVFHQSFRDFLIDPEKKGEYWFWVDKERGHANIAQKCLDLLFKKAVLMRDVCGFKEPGLEQTEYSTQVANMQITFEVQYACRFWAYHVTRSASFIAYEMELLRFLREHFLHWIEALSWMGRLSDGVTAIVSLRSCFLRQETLDIFAFLNEAYRFLLKHRYIVDLAPGQIYYSALVFSPKSSMARKAFEKEIKGFSRLPEVPRFRDSELLRLEGHAARVIASALSSDGLYVASASMDRTIRLWDSSTGMLLHELKGHVDDIGGIAFDKKFPSRLLASFSRDRTIRLWDVSTGIERKELQADDVSSVSFSSENVLICAAGRTVILWAEPWTMDPKTIQFDHKVFVAESHPTSKELSVVTSNDQVTYWKYPTLEKTHKQISIDAFRVRGNLFSLDSKQFKVLEKLYRGDKLVFSPQGNLLAAYRSTSFSKSKAGANIVQIWDSKTGAEVATLKHIAQIRDVAFSFDGQMLASCCENYVTLWDLTQASRSLLSETTSEYEHCFCLEDGSKFAFLGMDGLITFTDPLTGQVLSGTAATHSEIDGQRTQVTLSPNGHWLLCKPVIDAYRPRSTEGRMRIENLASSSSTTDLVVRQAIDVKDCYHTAFSKDSRSLAAVDAQTIIIWDLTANFAATKVHIDDAEGIFMIAGLSFSYDSKVLAIGRGFDVPDPPNAEFRQFHPSITKIEFLDLETLKLKPLALQSSDHNVTSFSGMAFSRDDKRFAAWQSKGILLLYDISKLGEISPPPPQRIDVDGFRLSDAGYFGPDDSCLITELGAIPLRPPPNAANDRNDHNATGAQYTPTISYRGEWVARNGKNFLWLPREYAYTNIVLDRPRRKVACTQNRLCILPRSGNPPAFFEFSPEQ